MKYIDKSSVPVPAVLTTKGVAEKNKNISEYRANIGVYTSHTVSANSNGVASSFDIKNAIYGDTTVKDSLINLQKKCCCFCESRITHISSGDVEHFRPKQGYSQDSNDLFHKPGYFWLSYDWSNLLFACERCNRRYKKNFFPLKNTRNRCNPNINFDVSAEEPLFIDPSQVDPTVHLSFKKTSITHKTAEGATTISELGLNRPDLLEMRLDSFSAIDSLKEIYERDKGSVNEADSADKLKQALNQKINITAQYSMMFRDNFATYIYKFRI
ncbi:MAG: hypothetical protein H6Q14_404 [Bacteroidetes bacterium]|nr:hypothetical protein [Bacteroidota bacterium]MBP1616577.1 hypothetical protein [Bacteroidota bacterium]